jgi:AraC-like DNA-binding protein
MLPLNSINIAYTPQLNLLYCGRLRLRKWHCTYMRVPYWRLYWNDRTGARFKDPDAAYHPIEPTHFTLVAPNTTLSRELARPVEHFYTHFTVGLPFARIQSCVHRFAARPLLVEAMKRDYVQGEISGKGTIRRSATALTLCWYALSTLPSYLLPATEDNPRLNDMLKWWEAREWQPITNSELAARIAMHSTAFCRYFKHVLGCPPHTYGLAKRIDQACLLLHFSELSIKQIAEKTGFCDRYYFSRTFKQLRGISPAAFRWQYATKQTGA